MEPKMEQPKQYTPEEIAQLEKSRTISDAEFLKSGAEYAVDKDGEKKLNVTNNMSENHVEYEKILHDNMNLSEKEQILRVKELLANESNKALDGKPESGHLVITYYDNAKQTLKFALAEPLKGYSEKKYGVPEVIQGGYLVINDKNSTHGLPHTPQIRIENIVDAKYSSDRSWI